MALPGGKQQGPPPTRLHSLWQWSVFLVLLIGFLATGLWRWFSYRLAQRWPG